MMNTTMKIDDENNKEESGDEDGDNNGDEDEDNNDDNFTVHECTNRCEPLFPLSTLLLDIFHLSLQINLCFVLIYAL